MSEIVQKDGVWLFGWSEEYTGAYQQWLDNGKPSNIIRDSLPYLRLDPALRMRLVREWNEPRPWPLAWAGLILLALVVPAWRAWSRRQRATALARQDG
jgi:hypothetical protein